MSDLLKIGTSGVLAQQTMLQTTSNNISNVSTVGYSRQETIIYTNILDQGCGETTTRRCINTYAQKELLIDNANVSYYNARMEGLSAVDSLLSDSNTGLASSITDLFTTIQSANTDPTSIANRNELMGSIDTFAQKVNTISQNIQEQYLTANKKIEENVANINQLLDGIYKMNSNIIKSSNNKDSAAYLQMQDERDRLVTELSQYLDIKTVPQDDGSCYVNMNSGQTLVLKDGCATLGLKQSTLDNTSYQLTITYNTQNSNSTILNPAVGGSLGGYFEACDSLKDVQRETGKLAWALADKLNTQNKSGLTLTNNLGSDIFTVAKNVACTSSASNVTGMTMSLMDGYGSNVTGNDYVVKYNSDNSGSDTWSVFEKKDGNLVELKPEELGFENDDEMQDAFKMADPDDSKTIALKAIGIEFTINGNPKDVSEDVEYLAQPTLNLGYSFNDAVTKPEDLAFSSVIRCNQNSQNMGNATIALNGVTNTLNNIFNISENTNTISLGNDAPVQVEIDTNGNYIVKNSAGEVLGMADAGTKGQNILANLYNAEAEETGADGKVLSYKLADPKVAVYKDYEEGKVPGFDFSISGTVKGGDKFSIEINTNGSADNSNGILMQNIEQQTIVNGNVNRTVMDSYAYIVSDVGTELKVSQINLEAAEAKQEQSSNLVESAKGVELNEEASNLVRFQQSYAASAKIISAAQTIFDALISAVG